MNYPRIISVITCGSLQTVHRIGHGLSLHINDRDLIRSIQYPSLPHKRSNNGDDIKRSYDRDWIVNRAIDEMINEYNKQSIELANQSYYHSIINNEIITSYDLITHQRRQLFEVIYDQHHHEIESQSKNQSTRQHNAIDEWFEFIKRLAQTIE